MKTKVLNLNLILIIVSFSSFSQLKVIQSGYVGVGTNNPTHHLHVSGNCFIDSYTPNWGRSTWTKTHNPLACAYNLYVDNYNRDVFFVCGDGWLWTLKGGYFGSDSIFKENISQINDPLNIVMNLNGIKYSFKDLDVTDTTEDIDSTIDYRIGLIAQEVEQVLPEVVKTMPDSTKAIAYTDMIALLIEAIKEQQEQIEDLQMALSVQEQDILTLISEVDICCGGESVQINNSSINEESYIEKAELYYCEPNPFTKETKIEFFIPETSKSSSIIIHDLSGLEIKSFEINRTGKSEITIFGSELLAGMYLYSLVVDSKLIDTKRMLLTK